MTVVSSCFSVVVSFKIPMSTSRLISLVAPEYWHGIFPDITQRRNREYVTFVSGSWALKYASHSFSVLILGIDMFLSPFFVLPEYFHKLFTVFVDSV